MYKIWYILCVKYCLYIDNTYGYKIIPYIFKEYRICHEVLSALQIYNLQYSKGNINYL